MPVSKAPPNTVYAIGLSVVDKDAVDKDVCGVVDRETRFHSVKHLCMHYANAVRQITGQS